MALRVLLVDDDAEMRRALSVLLALQAKLVVVGEAEDGSGAVEAAARLAPDVVVMDVNLPGSDGVEASRELRRRWPEARIVFVSAHVDADLEATARAAGACVIDKDELFERLVPAIFERIPAASG